MKKILLTLAIVAAFILGVTYFFIPDNIIVTASEKLKSNEGKVQRLLFTTEGRRKWMPQNAVQENGTTLYNGCEIIFPREYALENNFVIAYKNIQTACLITHAVNDDRLITSWSLSIPTTYNPVTRWLDYLQMKHLKSTLSSLQNALIPVAEDDELVYGFKVEQKKQADSTLISIRIEQLDHYPTMPEIYENIAKLQNYAKTNNAEPTNNPMLNIASIGSNRWTYMVALPITKSLENKDNIVAKRMFSGGNILITDSIVGGTQKIQQAIEQLENFRTDGNFMSPAIPFQSLLTDRMLVTDSNQWITRLYYPVY